MSEKYCSKKFKCGEDLDAALEAALCAEDNAKRSEDAATRAEEAAKIIESGEAAPVKSVNGKTGAVQLNAGDVGARPATWMPSADDVGALPQGADVLRYGAQTLTAEQKAQARENIGAEAEGSRKFFEVTITENEDGTYTSSHSYSEIYSAYNSGLLPVAVMGASRYSLVTIDTYLKWVVFGLLQDSVYRTLKVTISSTSVSRSTIDLATKDDIPEIPNIAEPLYLVTDNEITEDNTVNILGWVSGQEHGEGADLTELNNAYLQGRACFLLLPDDVANEVGFAEIPCLMCDGSFAIFGFTAGLSGFTAIAGDGTVYFEHIAVSPITINGETWDGIEPIDFTETINGMIDAKAKPGETVHYVVGTGTTEGEWLGTCDDITKYYDGLTILYKIGIAGVSGGSTLNINGLGACSVKRNASTAVTTIYPVGAIVLLTYSGGVWLTADYDSNTKTSSGTSNKVGTKMYLVGGTSQNSSGVTTYTNKNVYIGTDNRLYSNGAVVPNTDEINTLIDAKLGVIENGSY